MGDAVFWVCPDRLACFYVEISAPYSTETSTMVIDVCAFSLGGGGRDVGFYLD